MKRLLSVLLAALLVSTAALGAVGGAAAQTATPTPTPTDTETATPTPTDTETETEYVNETDETVSVSNDTRSLYVEVVNATEDVDVTVYGVEDGITTQVDTGTIAVDGGTLYEYDVNATAYGQYRVVVSGQAESHDVGKIEKVGGGLGGSLGDLGGESNQKAVGAVLLVALLGALALRN